MAVNVLKQNPNYHNLPAEYQEVEYIESSGTQYIDTGITANMNISYEVEFYVLSTSQFHGILGENTFAWGRLGLFQGGASLYPMVVEVAIGASVNEWHTAKYHYPTFDVDNRIITLTNGSTGNSTIDIFRMANYFSSCKAKYYKFYDNDVLVRNFIPCYRKSDNVIGMYDLVNDVFYTNAGTGTFLKGDDVVPYEIQKCKVNILKSTQRLPAEYREVEYIESSGTQYIDTGISNSANDSYEIEFTPLIVNNTQRYFGGLFTAGIALGLRNDGNIMVSSVNSWVYPNLQLTANQKIKVEYRSLDGWYLDDTKFETQTPSSDNDNNIFVCSVDFQGTAYSPASMKLYKYKHSDSNGTLKRNLIPCYRVSDDEVGMYDLVTEQFFTNAGTGDFAKGADVPNFEVQKCNLNILTLDPNNNQYIIAKI